MRQPDPHHRGSPLSIFICRCLPRGSRLQHPRPLAAGEKLNMVEGLLWFSGSAPVYKHKHARIAYELPNPPKNGQQSFGAFRVSTNNWLVVCRCWWSLEWQTPQPLTTKQPWVRPSTHEDSLLTQDSQEPPGNEAQALCHWAGYKPFGQR